MVATDIAPELPPGMRPIAEAVAFLLGMPTSGRKSDYWAASRWQSVPTRDNPANRTGHPWSAHDYDALIAWLRHTAAPEDVGRTRGSFAAHARYLLTNLPARDDLCVEAARQAVAGPDFQLPAALLDRLTDAHLARINDPWEDGEIEWVMRAIADGATLEFVTTVVQRPPHDITTRLTRYIPPLFTCTDSTDEQIINFLKTVLSTYAAPRRYLPPAAQQDTELVPRHTGATTRQHRESLALLTCSGWTDEDITRLLGDPDGVSLHTDPGYGTERVLLATLSDPALQSRLHPCERSHSLRRRLVQLVEENPGPVGVWVSLPGFGWLVLCRAQHATDGAEITLYPPTGQTSSQGVLVHPTAWGDYAVAAARPARTQQPNKSR